MQAPPSKPNRRPAGPTQNEDRLSKQHIETVRMLIQVQEAGQLIGKSGQTIAQIRRESIAVCSESPKDSNGDEQVDSDDKDMMVRIRLSEFQRGLKERVVSFSGGRLQLHNCFSSILRVLGESPSNNADKLKNDVDDGKDDADEKKRDYHVVSLLVPNAFMGAIIGKSGHRIQDIQSQTGARFVASDETLPNSTDRLLTISGTRDQVLRAFDAYLDVLYDDGEKSGSSNSGVSSDRRMYGHFNYEPMVGQSMLYNYRMPSSSGAGAARKRQEHPSSDSLLQEKSSTSLPQSNSKNIHSIHHHQKEPLPNAAEEGGEVSTETINVPAELVGAIIGRQGRRINDLRRLSNTQISIAEKSHDGATERQLKIAGTRESIERVLKMIYSCLETERKRLQEPRVVKNPE